MNRRSCSDFVDSHRWLSPACHKLASLGSDAITLCNICYSPKRNRYSLARIDRHSWTPCLASVGGTPMPSPANATPARRACFSCKMPRARKSTRRPPVNPVVIQGLRKTARGNGAVEALGRAVVSNDCLARSWARSAIALCSRNGGASQRTSVVD